MQHKHASLAQGFFWGVMAASAFLRQSSTAFKQSSPALRSVSGILISVRCMTQGGTGGPHGFITSFEAFVCCGTTTATHVVNLGGTASILRVLATHRFASLVIGALTTVTRTANNVVSEGTEHTSLAIWIWHSRSCKILRCLSLPLLVDLQRNNSPMRAKTRDLCILRLAESIGGNLIQN